MESVYKDGGDFGEQNQRYGDDRSMVATERAEQGRNRLARGSRGVNVLHLIRSSSAKSSLDKSISFSSGFLAWVRVVSSPPHCSVRPRKARQHLINNVKKALVGLVLRGLLLTIRYNSNSDWTLS